MGVKYIRIVSTNDLSEILCESKCGWLVVGGIVVYFWGELLVIVFMFPNNNNTQTISQRS
jgi:hypothetical protein